MSSEDTLVFVVLGDAGYDEEVEFIGAFADPKMAYDAEREANAIRAYRWTAVWSVSPHMTLEEWRAESILRGVLPDPEDEELSEKVFPQTDEELEVFHAIASTDWSPPEQFEAHTRDRDEVGDGLTDEEK